MCELYYLPHVYYIYGSIFPVNHVQVQRVGVVFGDISIALYYIESKRENEHTTSSNLITLKVH